MAGLVPTAWQLVPRAGKIAARFMFSLAKARFYPGERHFVCPKRGKRQAFCADGLPTARKNSGHAHIRTDILPNLSAKEEFWPQAEPLR